MAGAKMDALTLHGFASAIARTKGTVLDKKQYVMYKILACMFLLDLICSEGSKAT